MKKKIFLVTIGLLLFFSPVFAKEKIEYSNNQVGIHVFKINTKKYGDKIKPFITPRLQTTQKVYDENCFDFVVNGGFFDIKNGKSVSYVVIDNKLDYEISSDIEFTENLEKDDRLDKVLSRTELRILENKRHKLKFDIARHTDSIKKGYTIKHSLQGGPMVYPAMDLASEGFVVYDNGMVKSQYADILKRRERTALGLKGKYLYIVIFSKEHRVDVNELRDYMTKELKLDKVMLLDGGLSTSVNYKTLSIGSLGKYQRRVKSFLVIER